MKQQYFRVPHFAMWHTLRRREGFLVLARCGLSYNDLDDGKAKVRARIPKGDDACRMCAKHKAG